MNKKPFNLQFCEYIQRVELKNSQLADIIQVEPETISRWRTGKSLPSRCNLLKCIEPLEFTEIKDGLTKFNELLKLAKHLKLNLEEQKQYFPSQKTSFDWGDMRETRYFIGRANELEKLEQWIVQDKYRLISIVGFGGTGKTSLSIEFAGLGKTALSSQLTQNIGDNFEYVIWRSLRNALPIKAILTDIIKFISEQQDVEPSEHTIIRLLKHLKTKKCLIILDNRHLS